MNIALWIVQGLLGLAFVAMGYYHGFNVEQAKGRPGMQWMGVVPRGLMTFIGIAEMLGGVGLILPAATGILPWLTPVAAGLLALVLVLAALFHLPRREYPNMVFNGVLLALALLVAVGRGWIAPL